jgi:hypothetical protein
LQVADFLAGTLRSIRDGDPGREYDDLRAGRGCGILAGIVPALYGLGSTFMVVETSPSIPSTAPLLVRVGAVAMAVAVAVAVAVAELVRMPRLGSV